MQPCWSPRSACRASLGTCLALLPVAVGLAANPPSLATPGVVTTASARFEPVPWSSLPGWAAESHADALQVFVKACQRLRSRPIWQPLCQELAAAGAGADSRVPGGTAPARGEADEAARRFLEARFSAYRLAEPGLVSNSSGAGSQPRRDEGLLTGYFEPILAGRRQRGGRFAHPVYGTPPSMLYLDARLLAARPDGGRLDAVIRANQLVPASERRRVDEPAYPVVLDGLRSEPLDRRYRMRLDGGRLVRFPDRAAIEASPRPIGPVLAWVDDPDALYVMQVQGSGRIRFADGKELRLAYADQNGQPFTPRGTASTSQTRDVTAIRPEGALSRSLLALIESGPGREGAIRMDVSPAVPGPAEPSGESPGNERAAGSRTRSIPSRANDREVERVIEQLLAPRSGETAGGSRRATGLTAAPPATPPAAVRSDAARSSARALAFLARARKLDRSYVFFRVRDDREPGPPGALGVALTAGRSIAVDPRVTPLGAPVYIAAAAAAGDAPMQRLMVAQDTGGAIRGAVRADFFWGSGPGAGRQALTTRDTLAMWVLLPRGFLESRRPMTRTRSVDAGHVDCTAPDPDYCDAP